MSPSEAAVTSLLGSKRQTDGTSISELVYAGDSNHQLRPGDMAELRRERESLEERVRELESRLERSVRLQPLPPVRTQLPLEPPQGDPLPASRSQNGRHAKPIANPDRYDGTSPWSAYQKHFELCAHINGWDEVAKAHFLAMSLKGRAQQVLSNLGTWQLDNYAAIKEVLRSRFDPEGREELYRIQLRNRRQAPKETLVELAQDIRMMVDRAYTDMAEASKDGLAKDYFLDALPEAELRTRVLQMRPCSLQRALKDTIELEAINRAERERAASRNLSLPQRARAIAGPDDLPQDKIRGNRCDRQGDTNSIAELTKSIAGLTEGLSSQAKALEELRARNDSQTKSITDKLNTAMACMGEYQRREKPPQRMTPVQPVDQHRPRNGIQPGRSPGPMQGRQCYGCGQEGHFRRECPHNRSGN